MPDALPIDLGNDDPHSIEVVDGSFETDGDFDVVLHNHGPALHVHLNLDTGLSRAAAIGTANHYVEEDAVRRVRIRVDESRLPAEGRLKVVTGYGSETAFVPVDLVESDEREDAVVVDERLSRPPPRPEEPDRLVDPDYLPLVAILAVGLAAAVLSVLLVSDPVVLAGVLAAIVGVGAAAALLLIR